MATLKDAAQFALAEMDRDHATVALIVWEKSNGDLEHRTVPHGSKAVLGGFLKLLVQQWEAESAQPNDD